MGNTIDGTQAEYVRIPHAESGLYPNSLGADEDALVMLSDILPTEFECGVLNGKVQPDNTMVIVGVGPIGLAALLTAQFYTRAEIVILIWTITGLRRPDKSVRPGPSVPMIPTQQHVFLT